MENPKLAMSLLLAGLVVGCAKPQENPAATYKRKYPANAPLAPEDSEFPKPGRFRIVNGTPQFARNIMLLDTQTGRSWVTCEEKTGGTTTWCAIPVVGDAKAP